MNRVQRPGGAIIEPVIRRGRQGGEEAELMTVTAGFIRDAFRTVLPASGLRLNTPISLLCANAATTATDEMFLKKSNQINAE